MTTTPERPARSRLRRTARQARRRALSRLFGLGSPITDYTVEKGIRVPMRDGVDLVADHYAPTDDTSVVGTLLARSPYGRGFPFSTLYGRLYAARGYHVVLQSVRGTPGSGGEFHPFVDEASDGADTVEWLRRQPWFTGRFATIGQSYLGVTQWALLTDPPPELAAAVVTAAPHDVRASMWSTGAFTLDDVLGWSDVVSHQEHSSRLRRMIWSAGARRRLARAMSGLPLGESSRALLDGSAAWFESWIEHREPDTTFWEPYHFGAALARVTTPVLLIGGWQDSFLSQTLEQYQTLRDRGVDVALTVGPWTHTQLTTTGARRVAHESLEWLDRHLAGDQPGPARNPVRVHINGDDWIELPSWPPASSSRLLYLSAGAALVDRLGGSALVELHLRPRRSDSCRRRAAGPRTPGRISRGQRVGSTRGCTELHVRAVAVGSLRCRPPHARIVARRQHPARRPRRADKRGRLAGTFTQRQRRISAPDRDGRTGCRSDRVPGGGAPLPGGVENSAARRRRRPSAIRPQSRHWRAADYRATIDRGDPHRAPWRGRILAAGPAGNSRSAISRPPCEPSRRLHRHRLSKNRSLETVAAGPPETHSDVANRLPELSISIPDGAVTAS